MPSIRVKFKGKDLWLLADDDGDFGALAPLEHCDENGEVLFEHCMSVSFAHVYPDGTISQFGRKIGTREDLERI